MQMMLVEQEGDLSVVEQSRLGELEATIDRHREALREVAEALREIRDSRLYRATHGTFEDYVAERFAFTRQRAYQLIDFAEVAERVSTVVDIPVASERVARELATLPVEAQPVAYAEAVEVAGGKTPSSKQVKAAVAKHKPRKAKQKPHLIIAQCDDDEPVEVEEVVEPVVDGTRCIRADDGRHDWNVDASGVAYCARCHEDHDPKNHGDIEVAEQNVEVEPVKSTIDITPQWLPWVNEAIKVLTAPRAAKAKRDAAINLLLDMAHKLDTVKAEMDAGRLVYVKQEGDAQ